MKIIYPESLLLGEGPIWDERLNNLYFLDILNKRLFEWQYFNNTFHCYQFNEYISCIALTNDPKQLYIALESGIYSFDLTSNQKIFICDPEKRANYRYNDGTVDPFGNWLIGSMNNINNGPEATLLPDASLFKIVGNDSQVLIDPVTISNGIAFQSGWMYYIDSKLNSIRKYQYTKQGISEPKIIYEHLEKNILDGMCISKSNKLYVANWAGAKILIFCLEKELVVGEIDTKALNPTSCAFGGPNLDELFVTTAQLDDPIKNQPGLLCFKLKDNGFPENKIQLSL